MPFTLLKEVQRINRDQKDRFLKSMRDALWVLRDKKIAVWGLTFKPDTDDVRSSVAIDIVNDLVKEGATVTAYDPKGMEKAREFKLIPESVKLVDSPLAAVDGAEALVVATEWKEFADVNLSEVKAKMATAMIFDGRNLFDPAMMKDLGFIYKGIGRAAATAG